MDFEGVVISDYQDVQALQTAYHVAASPAEAIAKAVNAGVDMAMYVTGPDQWQTATLQAVHSHMISTARINEAVRRILTLKFQLGLFTNRASATRARHASTPAPPPQRSPPGEPGRSRQRRNR